MNHTLLFPIRDCAAVGSKLPPILGSPRNMAVPYIRKASDRKPPPDPQLYDILVDPRESRNLVYKKTYAVVEANMLMRAHLAEMKKYPNRVRLPPI